MAVATERSSLGAVSTVDAASGARSRFWEVLLLAVCVNSTPNLAILVGVLPRRGSGMVK